MPNGIWTFLQPHETMTMEPTGNTELDKLLQEVKRTILENRSFLETLKQEPFSEVSDTEDEDESVEVAIEEPFEEL